MMGKNICKHTLKTDISSYRVASLFMMITYIFIEVASEFVNKTLKKVNLSTKNHKSMCVTFPTHLPRGRYPPKYLSNFNKFFISSYITSFVSFKLHTVSIFQFQYKLHVYNI